MVNIHYKGEIYKPKTKFDKVLFNVFEKYLKIARSHGKVRVIGESKYIEPSHKECLPLREQSIYSEKGYLNFGVVLDEEFSTKVKVYRSNMDFGLVSNKSPKKKRRSTIKFKVDTVCTRGLYDAKELVNERDFRTLLNKNLEYILDL